MALRDSSVFPASERTRAVTAIVVGRSELAEHLGRHPEPPIGAVGGIRRAHDEAVGADQARQLARQPGLSRAGVTAEQRHVGLPVPADPVPQRFEIGHLLLAPEKRQVSAR